MLLSLSPFPGTSAPDINKLTVEINRPKPNQLELTYRLAADLDEVALPAASTFGAQDNLWQHTCFELFFRAQDDDAYHEYNFSPSNAWNHYSFTSYRQRDMAAAKVAPAMDFQRLQDTLIATVTVPIDIMGPLELSLTAVMEDNQDNITYWATAHAGEAPDFHHPDSFTIALV